MDMWAKEPIKKTRSNPEERKLLPTDRELEVVNNLMIRKEKEGHLIYDPNNFTITYASEGLMSFLAHLKREGKFTVGELENKFKNIDDLCILMSSLNERRLIR